MATNKQKKAARRNIGKARQAQSARAHGEDVPGRGAGLSTADKDRLDDQEFAFPKERKEPLTDARHVGNASPPVRTSLVRVTAFMGTSSPLPGRRRRY